LFVDYQTQGTYLTVEYQGSNNEWTVLLVDGDWDTKFWWQRHDILGNLITVTWNIGSNAPSGTYRIRHFGASKDIFGKITPYTGVTSTFNVVV
jgi:neutral ceramidase